VVWTVGFRMSAAVKALGVPHDFLDGIAKEVEGGMVNDPRWPPHSIQLGWDWQGNPLVLVLKKVECDIDLLFQTKAEYGQLALTCWGEDLGQAVGEVESEKEVAMKRTLDEMTRLEWLMVIGAVIHYVWRMEGMECPHNIVPGWPKQAPVLKKFLGIMNEVLGDEAVKDAEEYAD
jgi:hypothetical protein